MKARILVCHVNDGDEYVVLETIADEGVMDANETFLSEEVEKARQTYGKALIAHGFVDVEIPDTVIAKVIRQVATAGVVPAEAVEASK